MHYMTIGNGSCGSSQHDAATIARIRRDEAALPRRTYLGATFHESLVQRHRDLLRPPDARAARLDRPRGCARNRADAFAARLHGGPHQHLPAGGDGGVLPRHAQLPVDPPRPAIEQDVTIYHAQPHGNCDPLRQPIVPELFVDVTQVIDRKDEMLAKHASQKSWLDESQGMDSYIEAMHELNEEVGRMSGRFQYAEGWRRHLHLGFSAARMPTRWSKHSSGTFIVERRWSDGRRQGDKGGRQGDLAVQRWDHG